MLRKKYKIPLFIIAVGDIILLSISFYISKTLISIDNTPSSFSFLSLIILESFLWIVLSIKFNLYEIPRIINNYKILSKNSYVFFVFLILSGGLIFFITNYKFSREFLLITMLFFFLFLFIWKIFLVNLLIFQRRKGYDQSKILLVGINNNIITLINKVYLEQKYGFKIVGLFTDAEITTTINNYYKGKLHQIMDYLKENQVDEIVISLPYQYSDLINYLFAFADNNMIRMRVIPEFSEYLSQTFSIGYSNKIPILKLRKEPLKSLSNRICKRIFDIVFSSLVIVFIFSWLFPVIALIIKLTSKGPVFFVQQRTGEDGKSFKCLKFRSMKINKESDTIQATKNDSRVTNFGSFMRKTSIDELPQFFNVLFNKMSIVGPRPHMLKHTEEYRFLVDKFMVRHFAKPGVTGWAQINGYRGQTKKIEDMENRAKADIWYIENWSFLLDLKIIFLTFWMVVFKKEDNAF